jgi:molybdate transport system regulatory protein
MNIFAKVFLQEQGKYIFGPGRAALLRAVDELGSLRKAAHKLGMSYRWAWGRLNDAEKALGVSLLAHEPGSGGKGKTLTGEGRELLAWYDVIEKSMASALAQADAIQPAFLRTPDFGNEKVPGKNRFN